MSAVQTNINNVKKIEHYKSVDLNQAKLLINHYVQKRLSFTAPKKKKNCHAILLSSQSVWVVL